MVIIGLLILMLLLFISAIMAAILATLNQIRAILAPHDPAHGTTIFGMIYQIRGLIAPSSVYDNMLLKNITLIGLIRNLSTNASKNSTDIP